MAPEDDNRRFFDLVSIVDRGSVGPVLLPSTVARFRHLATVLGAVRTTIHWIVF